MTHDDWMNEALALARDAQAVDEVPVGAVVVLGDKIVGRGFNQPIGKCDPTAHAEIQAMRDAAIQLGNYRLVGCQLYVTLEPCTMCVGAMVYARIDTLVYGASEFRSGAVTSQLKLLDSSAHNHQVNAIGGILEPDCREVLQAFFKARRKR